VISTVAGRVPTSVALGELKDNADRVWPVPLPTYVKLGLAGSGHDAWEDKLLALRDSSAATFVPTCYADNDRAHSPHVESVARFVIENRFPVLLIDTFIKDGYGLFSWIDGERLKNMKQRLAAAGCRLALAGSLTADDMPALLEIHPEWMAVRGAVCRDSVRDGEVCPERVRRLKAQLTHLPDRLS